MTSETPIAWRRKQVLTRPYGDIKFDPIEKSYNDYMEFFNAQVAKYKNKILNDLKMMPHILVSDSENYIEEIEMLANDEQLDKLDDFVKRWVWTYRPKYVVRIDNQTNHNKQEILYFSGGYCDLEEPSETVKKVFLVVRNDSGAVKELTETNDKKRNY